MHSQRLNDPDQRLQRPGTSLAPLLLLLTLIAFWSPVTRAADHCVILQYHHFSDTTPASTSISPTLFQQHLDYLKEQQFQVLPLQQVIDAFSNGTSLPERCVSITVDDAYLSVYQEAFPRLQALGWPFTVFINTAAITSGNRHYMSWQQMQEMAHTGVRFENHSHHHDHLIRQRPGEGPSVWKKRVTDDILQAQQLISRNLGQTPTLFAYPYGEYNEELKGIVGDLGLAAFGQQSGPAWRGADRLALPRFPMAASFARLASFRLKVNTLPLPIDSATPAEPVLQLDQWRPRLSLQFTSGRQPKTALRCYFNGAPDLTISWDTTTPGLAHITPNRDLQVGRNRYNCTMDSPQQGRYHWYSHNWIRPKADGSWYNE